MVEKRTVGPGGPARPKRSAAEIATEREERRRRKERKEALVAVLIIFFVVVVFAVVSVCGWLWYRDWYAPVSTVRSQLASCNFDEADAGLMRVHNIQEDAKRRTETAPFKSKWTQKGVFFLMQTSEGELVKLEHDAQVCKFKPVAFELLAEQRPRAELAAIACSIHQAVEAGLFTLEELNVVQSELVSSYLPKNKKGQVICPEGR